MSWQDKLNQRATTQPKISNWQETLNKKFPVKQVDLTPPSIPGQERASALAKYGITESTAPKMSIPNTLGGPGLGFEFTSTKISPITDASKALARDISTEQKKKLRGGSFDETKMEIDHIVPVSLGGTRADYNLQALLSTGTEIDERQGGTLRYELDQIDKYQKGLLTQGQAIYNILQYDWADENKKKQIEKEIQPPNVLKQAASAALDQTKRKVQAALPYVVAPFDYLYRTGLQVIAGATPFVSGSVESLAKLTGDESLKDVSYDELWKQSFEGAGDMMIDIGAPSEALKVFVGKQPKEVKVPALETQRKQYISEALSAEKNFEAAKSPEEKNQAIADYHKAFGKLAWTKFVEDWSNPFYLFSIKGVSSGSFKLTPKEKILQKIELNPAKEGFLSNSGVPIKEQTKVMKIETQPSNVVAEVTKSGKVKNIQNPDLQMYVTTRSNGSGSIIITNKGGDIINKKLVQQLAEDPLLLTKETGQLTKQQIEAFRNSAIENVARASDLQPAHSQMYQRWLAEADFSSAKNVSDLEKIANTAIIKEKAPQSLVEAIKSSAQHAEQIRFNQIISPPNGVPLIPDAKAAIVDGMKLSQKAVDRAIIDVSQKANFYLTGSPSKVTPTGQAIAQLQGTLTHVDSPGKLYTEIAKVIKADKTLDPTLKATLLGQVQAGGSARTGLGGTIQDFFISMKDPELANLPGVSPYEQALEVSNKVLSGGTSSGKAVTKTIEQLTEEAKKYKTPEEFIASQTKYKAGDDLTTTILEQLKDKTQVSRQFIEDLTKQPQIKQVERELIRGILDKYKGAQIAVTDFIKDVQSKLLPLKVTTYDKQIDKDVDGLDYSLSVANGGTRYESTVLDNNLRGPIEDYAENVYVSPVETNAGVAHFPEVTNYFGHTRVEDIPDDIRRIIEVQSDLYQKGNLEREGTDIYRLSQLRQIQENGGKLTDAEVAELSRAAKEVPQRISELEKLDQYNNPTAHFRLVREEIQKAIDDGKLKIQFPTGETAMKIEGIGDLNAWYKPFEFGTPVKLTDADLKVGSTIVHGTSARKWVITDVLGEGRFKAVPERIAKTNKRYKIVEDTRANGRKVFLVKNSESGEVSAFRSRNEAEGALEQYIDYNNAGFQETFDLSNRINRNDPIYLFYEKTLGRYLQNQYKANRITDERGVTWNEIDLTGKEAGKQVTAFKTGRVDDYNIKKGQAVAILRKYFPENEVKFLTSENLGRTPDSRVIYGKYANAIISVVEKNGKVSESVVLHEAFHKYIDQVVDPKTKEALFKEVRDKYSSELKANYNEEEWLADNFAEFVRGSKKSWTDRIKKFFTDLLEKVKSWLGKEDKIRKAFTDLESGKAKTVEMRAPGDELREIWNQANKDEIFYHRTSVQFDEFAKTVEGFSEEIPIHYLTTSPSEAVGFAVDPNLGTWGKMARVLKVDLPELTDKNTANLKLTSKFWEREDPDFSLTTRLENLRKKGYSFARFDHPNDEGKLVPSLAVLDPSKIKGFETVKELSRGRLRYDEIGTKAESVFKKEIDSVKMELEKTSEKFKASQYTDDELRQIWENANKKLPEKEVVSTQKTRQASSDRPVKLFKGEVKESSAYKRLLSKIKTSDPNIPEYEAINLAENQVRANTFVYENPEIAIKVAKGLELPPEGMTLNSITSAVIDKALKEGDYDLASALSARLSLRATRQGQEIASLKLAYSDNDPQYFINQLLQERSARNLKIKYEGGKAEVRQAVQREARSTRKAIDKRAAQIQSAQELLNSLIC